MRDDPAAGPAAAGRAARVRVRVRVTHDRGGIVAGWLVKLALVFAVVGIVVFDGVAIAYTRVTAADDAGFIARGASEAMLLQNVSDERALKVAEDRAEQRGVVLGRRDVVIAKDGSVHVRISRTADTLVAHYIGPLQRFLAVTATADTPPLPR